VTSSWFFLSTLNYDARSTTHQIDKLLFVADPPRLEKSPLLANGYNHPPTHLNHMQFMQLNHHPAAAHTAILSPAGIPHHGLARADGSIIKNQGIPGMDAIAR